MLGWGNLKAFAKIAKAFLNASGELLSRLDRFYYVDGQVLGKMV